MNFKLMLLGGLPPFLSLLAEAFNPVSGETAASHTSVAFQNIIDARGRAEAMVESERSIAKDVVARTVDGAVEVAGIVPAWISVIAGLVGIATEVLPVATATTSAIVLAGISALFLIYFFSRCDYYRLAEAPGRKILGAKSRSQLISRTIMACDLLVIVFALGAGFAS